MLHDMILRLNDNNNNNNNNNKDRDKKNILILDSLSTTCDLPKIFSSSLSKIHVCGIMQHPKLLF